MGLDMYLFAFQDIEGLNYEEISQLVRYNQYDFRKNMIERQEEAEDILAQISFMETYSFFRTFQLLKEEDLNKPLSEIDSNTIKEEFEQLKTEFLESDPVTLPEDILEKRNQNPFLKEIYFIDSSESTEEVMYWRKANHIHDWFVRNVQNGEDDCGDYVVSNSKLKMLYNTLNRAIELYEENKQEELETVLPTRSGFFFGGTEYDEYYHEDNVETRDKLSTLLNNDKYDAATFIYSSSW